MSLQQWLGEVAARLGLDLGLRARMKLMKLVTRDLLTGIKISKAKIGS